MFFNKTSTIPYTGQTNIDDILHYWSWINLFFHKYEGQQSIIQAHFFSISQNYPFLTTK